MPLLDLLSLIKGSVWSGAIWGRDHVEAYRFEDPGDSSSKEWFRPLFPALPNVLKRGNLDDVFSFSCIFLRSFAFSTSVLLSSRKPPESAFGAGPGAAAVSGLVETSTSSNALPWDLRRAVKRPSDGLTMLSLSTARCWAGVR